MDGNGRWATKRFLPRVAGHKQGVDSLRRCVKACAERGVGVLTVFAFSSENWNRPADEVSGLMELMAICTRTHSIRPVMNFIRTPEKPRTSGRGGRGRHRRRRMFFVCIMCA